MREAASGTGPVIIGHWRIADDDIAGDLYMEHRDEGVEFVFKFEGHPDKPRFIRVIAGQKEPIRLDRVMSRWEKEPGIRSTTIPWDDWNAEISWELDDENG